MELDREYQRQFLKKLAEAYPEEISYSDVRKDPDGWKAYENYRYLKEHGLVDGRQINFVSGEISFSVKATAKGIDFINENGLTQILGIVTVRLHEDTVRDMVALRIQDSSLTEKEKSHLLSSLKALPADAIRHLTLRLMDMGLDTANLPDLLAGIFRG